MQPRQGCDQSILIALPRHSERIAHAHLYAPSIVSGQYWDVKEIKGLWVKLRLNLMKKQ